MGGWGGKQPSSLSLNMKKLVTVLFLSTCLFDVRAAPVSDDDKPIDPFDYNFCGGERVYPIVGVNIATACGPRNQIALGRRGKIMWFFPGSETEKGYQGQMKLSKDQLARLSILAEVAKVTDNVDPVPSKMIYKMGINFSGRQPKYIYSTFDETYTPSNELLRQIISLVPASEKPHFPDCKQALTIFDPTLHKQDRKNNLLKTIIK